MNSHTDWESQEQALDFQNEEEKRMSEIVLRQNGLYWEDIDDVEQNIILNANYSPSQKKRHLNDHKKDKISAKNASTTATAQTHTRQRVFQAQNQRKEKRIEQILNQRYSKSKHEKMITEEMFQELLDENVECHRKMKKMKAKLQKVLFYSSQRTNYCHQLLDEQYRIRTEKIECEDKLKRYRSLEYISERTKALLNIEVIEDEGYEQKCFRGNLISCISLGDEVLWKVCKGEPIVGFKFPMKTFSRFQKKRTY